jgi:hypothetical protein
MQKVSYREFLGLSQEEYEEFLKDESNDECNEIDCWIDLEGKEINGYKFTFLGREKSTMTVENKDGIIGTFYLNRTPTFAIESFLMVLEVYVMVLLERVD